MKFNLLKNFSKFKSNIIMTSVILFSIASSLTIVSANNVNSGKWMSGEYHIHTIQSNDASEEFMNIQNILNVAFRQNMGI